MARNAMVNLVYILDEAQEMIQVAWDMSQDFPGYDDSDITGYVDIGLKKLKAARKQMKAMERWMRVSYARIDKWEDEASRVMNVVERRKKR